MLTVNTVTYTERIGQWKCENISCGMIFLYIKCSDHVWTLDVTNFTEYRWCQYIYPLQEEWCPNKRFKVLQLKGKTVTCPGSVLYSALRADEPLILFLFFLCYMSRKAFHTFTIVFFSRFYITSKLDVR